MAATPCRSGSITPQNTTCAPVMILKEFANAHKSISNASAIDEGVGGRKCYHNTLEQDLNFRQLRTLQNDRQIQIHIGRSNNPPFFIPPSVLCSASEYFVKAIANIEKMGEGTPGVLRFPEDDLEAWELMLFWMHKSTLPQEVAYPIMLLCQAWMLGDRYFLQSFQDLVMLELMCFIPGESLSLSNITMVFRGTMPGSALRQIVAEEAWSARSGGISGDTCMTDFDDLDGAVGVTGSMLAAAQKSAQAKENGDAGVHRLTRRDMWEKYMVGEKPPRSHWIWSWNHENFTDEW